MNQSGSQHQRPTTRPARETHDRRIDALQDEIRRLRRLLYRAILA